MAAPIDRLTFVNLTETGTETDYVNKNYISIINNSGEAITIKNSNDGYAGVISLLDKQNMELKASAGFTLPTIRITTSSGSINVSVSYS